MTTAPSRRMLFVHAHPDDETITTGGAIAHYRGLGVDVTVVTCTLGEEGEVIGDRWAGLAAGAADQLGGYRIGELTAALTALGVTAPRFLGSAGRWRDSGMAGTPAAAHPRAFVNADVDDAVAALVSVLDEVRPQVVVTYDPFGGYGHPDHIQAHRVTTAAVEAAGWDVPKFYWVVSDRAALAAALPVMGSIPVGWHASDDIGDWVTVPPEEVTAVLDIGHVLDAKRAALAAHATQITVTSDGRAYALSNGLATPVLGAEHFALVRGVAGPTAADGREHDLFGGLE